MIVSQLIQRMHRRYAGDTKYPTVGTSDYQMYLDIANDLKDQWATDPGHKWNSCFEERTYGAASSALAYDLDDDVNDLSDFVYIDLTNGNTRRFRVIKEKDRNSKRRAVYLSGSDPKQINFTDMPDDCIGGTIRAGIYFIPEDMANANDTVPIDHPNWVALAGAAELAFNDPSKEDKFGNLLGLANDEYQKMADAADTLPQDQIDSIPTEGFINPGGEGWHY